MKLIKDKDVSVYGLCHRCEWRAYFKETGGGPRSECKSEGSVVGCYMYQPVTPIVFKPRRGDRRLGIPGSMISSRVERVGLLKYRIVVEKDRSGTVLYKIPLTREAEKEIRDLKKQDRKRIKDLIKKRKT